MAGISKKRVKNKEGKETIRYVITYRDITGKQHTYGNYDKVSDARKDLDKFDTKINSSKILTIGEITKLFIDSRAKKNRASTTIEKYNYYNNMILTDFRDVKYSKITAYDWQQWLYKQMDKISVFAADGCYKLLRASFKYAKKFKKIIENTFEEVEPIGLPKVTHNHFDSEELKRMLDVCKREFAKYYAMFFTFVVSGAREGEIFGLKKCYVDFNNHSINIAGQFSHGIYKEKLKTEKSCRTLYMFPKWESILYQHIMNDKTNSEYVFHNENGNPYSPSNIRQRFWHKLLEACGYPTDYARIHDLRGSNSDLSIALGLSITYTAESLGHYDAETTRKYYNQNNKTLIADAVNKYEKFFEKCEPNVSQSRPTNKNNIIYFPIKRINKEL